MTTREIAEAVGKTERCVQGWAKKTGEKIASVGEKIASAGHGKFADFDLEETCAIIETGMGKNAADLYRMASREKTKAGSNDRLDRLEAMVIQLVGAISAMVPSIAKEAPKAITAPAIAPRDELRQIIANAAKNSGDYPGTWNQFYEEVFYRLHINAKLRAKNAKVPALDILEAEGLLPDCIAIARDIF